MLANILSGLIRGLVGAPNFRSFKNSKTGKWQSPIVWDNNIVSRIKSNISEARDKKEAVDELNNLLANGQIEQQMKSLINIIGSQKLQEKAEQEGDDFLRESAEFKEVFHTISLFQDLGQMKVFKKLLKENLEFQEKDLDHIVKNTTTTTQDENGNIIRQGPFLYSDGTSMATTESGRKQMLESLSKYKERINRIIDDFIDRRDLIIFDANQNFTSEQATELTFLMMRKMSLLQQVYEEKTNLLPYLQNIKNKKIRELENQIQAKKNLYRNDVQRNTSQEQQSVISQIDLEQQQEIDTLYGNNTTGTTGMSSDQLVKEELKIKKRYQQKKQEEIDKIVQRETDRLVEDDKDYNKTQKKLNKQLKKINRTINLLYQLDKTSPDLIASLKELTVQVANKFKVDNNLNEDQKQLIIKQLLKLITYQEAIVEYNNAYNFFVKNPSISTWDKAAY